MGLFLIGFGVGWLCGVIVVLIVEHAHLNRR